MILFLIILAITILAFMLFALAIFFSDKKECNCKKARRIVATYGKENTKRPQRSRH